MFDGLYDKFHTMQSGINGMSLFKTKLEQYMGKAPKNAKAPKKIKLVGSTKKTNMENEFTRALLAKAATSFVKSNSGVNMLIKR